MSDLAKTVLSAAAFRALPLHAQEALTAAYDEVRTLRSQLAEAHKDADRLGADAMELAGQVGTLTAMLAEAREAMEACRRTIWPCYEGDHWHDHPDAVTFRNALAKYDASLSPTTPAQGAGATPQPLDGVTEEME